MLQTLINWTKFNTVESLKRRATGFLNGIAFLPPLLFWFESGCCPDHIIKLGSTAVVAGKMVNEVTVAMDSEEKVTDDALDLSELENHSEIVQNVNALHQSVDRIDKIVDTLCKSDIYASLDVESRVKHDLFVSYSLNSLFWMYLRTKGCNPARTQIKSEIGRVKTYFDKFQKIRDRKTVMPRIDQGATKRFVKSSLWEPQKEKKKKQ